MCCDEMSNLRRVPNKSATANMLPLLLEFKEMDTANSILRLVTKCSSFFQLVLVTTDNKLTFVFYLAIYQRR